MDWISVAALGIIWTVILVPRPRRGAPKVQAFPDLRENAELERDEAQQPGRWVLAPRKGARFIGPRERARRRARERRRRIIVVLLEAVAVTALIGLFPPLRGMLVLTAVLGFVLLAYIGLVLYVVAGGQKRGPTSVASIPEPQPPLRVIRLPESRIEFEDEPPRVRIAAR